MKGRSHPQCRVLREWLKESFFAAYNAIMIALRPLRISASLGVVLMLLMISAAARIQKMKHISTGLWGGPHISMKVGTKSATIEYDCANGVIDGPLTVDANGNFSLRGTHHRAHGGPIRADESSTGEPATYTGAIEGNTMTLTLKVGDADEETFKLEKGKEGELFRCK
jgi:hypothetical protein